jgi:hypothetical protein|tara:strand:+ start:3549 stop:5744 length:2196 start_codon:yes stop_codon:yes gene_type:complete
MAKPKMQTITRKDWDKKHKDFKLIGKDKIPYIMVYDNGTKLIPVKIIEGEIEESVASAIDQIRQDSKDIRDFLKKVFSDSDFRAMKNDKDFVQYLKSIYEGVSVNEINSSVNKRRAGAELKQKLKGKRSDGMGKYTATIYGLDSKGKRVELKSLNDLNKYSKFELDESVNEGLKHNDMYTMLDIAAGYSSTQDQAANQMWSDEQDLYDYLKSDHIPKKYHKKFHNDIKRRFKDIKESVVTEGRSINAISKLQQKNIDDIAKALDFYKKNKDTDKKEAFIKVLKKLGDEKKKLAKELDDKVSGMYKDAEYKGESVVTEAGDTKATLTKRRANLVKSNERFGNLESNPNRRKKISVNNAEIKSIDSKLKSLNKNESVVNEGKFKKDDLVYNKRTKTVGIVRLGDDKSGEVKTDADGNVDVDELEKYNPIKNKHQNNAKVAPSTEKEVSKRGLFNPFKNESVVTEAKEDDVIIQLRKIVKDKQNALVVDTKSKKKVRVDMQSASLMVQVYDALKQQSNKDKFVKSGIVAMGHMAYKLMKNEGVNEGDGLWANIRAKKARGEKPAHKNSKAHKDAVKAGDKIKKDESVNEAKAFVVMFKVKKDINNRNIKPASAAYSSEVDAKKFLKSVEKDGGKAMIIRSNISGMKVNEAKDEIYFKSYTHAIEAAEVMAGKKGYTIEDDELFNKVGMNSKRPSVGKTTKVNLELLKNGKPQKKMLHIQVYGMKNGYELNAYIN